MSSTIRIRSTPPTASNRLSVYGTTAGGTPRISYSRDQLLTLASSPLSRSPPNFELPAAISKHPPPSHISRFNPPTANATTTAHQPTQLLKRRDSEDDAFKFEL